MGGDIYIKLDHPDNESSYLPIMEEILCEETIFNIDDPCNRDKLYTTKRVHKTILSENFPLQSTVLYVLTLDSCRFQDNRKKQELAKLYEEVVTKSDGNLV